MRKVSRLEPSAARDYYDLLAIVSKDDFMRKADTLLEENAAPPSGFKEVDDFFMKELISESRIIASTPGRRKRPAAV